MADSFWTQIIIGGRVTAAQWERMCEAEESLDEFDPATGELSGTAKRYHRDVPRVESFTQGDQPPVFHLYYSADQATNGQFEGLEAVLVAEGIPFDRSSDGFCEYPPETRFFRPGVADITAYGQEGVGDVMPTAVAMDYIEKGMSLDDIMALGEEADASIRLAILSERHKLPQFEYVEE